MVSDFGRILHRYVRFAGEIKWFSSGSKMRISGVWAPMRVKLQITRLLSRLSVDRPLASLISLGVEDVQFASPRPLSRHVGLRDTEASDFT